jgi:hypothetical protein
MSADQKRFAISCPPGNLPIREDARHHDRIFPDASRLAMQIDLRSAIQMLQAEKMLRCGKRPIPMG